MCAQIDCRLPLPSVMLCYKRPRSNKNKHRTQNSLTIPVKTKRLACSGGSVCFRATQYEQKELRAPVSLVPSPLVITRLVFTIPPATLGPSLVPHYVE